MIRTRFGCLLFVLLLWIDLSWQDCNVLKQKFEDMCKLEGEQRTKQIQKAKECYPHLLPADGDPKVKEYFVTKCQDIDYCDPIARKKCGPDAFNTLDDNQREAAMKFFEKHRQEFPDLCKKGIECIGFK